MRQEQRQQWQEVALAAAVGGPVLGQSGRGFGQQVWQGLQENLQGLQHSVSTTRSR